MPYKLFADGDVLTAGEVNTFMMNQQITVFADAAARGSAIANPVHGMVSFRKDNDRFYFFNGNNWRAL